MPKHSHTILAIDASTDQCSVSLQLYERCISRVCDVPKSHAQKLLPMVDEVLGEASCSLNSLDAIAVTLGPGSFTGVRIGLAVAQGLAYGADVPLIGGNSLEVLAYGLLSATDQPVDGVVSCFDARMGEVYWCAYDRHGDRLVERGVPVVTSPEEFNASLRGLSGRYIAAGHGVGLESVSSAPFAEVVEGALPHAKHLMDLWEPSDMTAEIENAKKAAIVEIEPCYLRNEVAWEKRKRIRKLENEK